MARQYEAIQTPRQRAVVAKARRLAAALEVENEKEHNDSRQVPIWRAVEQAIDEALIERGETV